jgi:putative endonuclease
LQPCPGGEPACRQAGLVDAKVYMFFVYAIRSCVRNYIYVGLTNNVVRRVIEHNKQENTSTKTYAPFLLILKETYDTRIEARKREKYLKSGVGKEFLKSLIR